MDWRLKKQITIFSIFLLIVLGGGFGIFYYFFHEPPTCFDNKQNQGEEETDCGGPCAPCAFRHEKPVQVFFARVVKARGADYDVVAQIQNPNDHLSGNPLSYRVRIYDDAGAKVGERIGSTFIYPNDKMYVVESNFPTERRIARTEFSVIEEDTKWTYTNDLRPELTLGNKKYAIVNEGGIEEARASADLVNRSPLSFENVDVRVLLLDASSNIIGVAKTVVSKVKSGESQHVEFNWVERPEGEVVRIDMEARANGLDPSNVSLP